MTATVDSGNVVVQTVASTATTFSFSVTVGSGDNFLLLIGDIWGANISGATFNSVALTKKSDSGATAPDMVSSVWSLANPPVGTFTLAGTLASAATGGSMVFAVPMSGVNTTSPLGTASYTDNTSSPVTTVATTATGAGSNDIYVGSGFMTCATIANVNGNMTNLAKSAQFQGQIASVDSIAGTNTGLMSYSGTGGGQVEALATAIAVFGSTAAASLPANTRLPPPLLGSKKLGPLGLGGFAIRARNTPQVPQPPAFSGPIGNHSYTQNTGNQTLNAGAFFNGATSYSISPSPDTGITFNTGTGVITTNTATTALGSHGPYTVTGTNSAGSTNSDAFTLGNFAASTGQALFRRRLHKFIQAH